MSFCEKKEKTMIGKIGRYRHLSLQTRAGQGRVNKTLVRIGIRKTDAGPGSGCFYLDVWEAAW